MAHLIDLLRNLGTRFGQEEDADCDVVFYITDADQPGESGAAKRRRLEAEAGRAPSDDAHRLPGHQLVLKLASETCKTQVSRHACICRLGPQLCP